MPPRRVRWLLLAALSVAPRTSAAADEEPAADKIEAPTPREKLSVPYPGEATGTALVVVELVIDATGAVSSAKIVEGSEPFARAALAAAPTWRFEPARKNGVPALARIRVEVDFKPPPPPPPEEPKAPPAGPARPARPDEPVEVNVRGARAEVGRTEMGSGDVRQLPGAFGDAFRAIDALPGVTPIASGLPYYFIRGAPPGNTGYMIDGVRVPLLFHFGVARSVIHPALIDHVDFYAGGYPARYGRFTGGIIDGITKAPGDKLHGEWDVNLLHAGAYLEAPIGERATATVAGRYGYPGLLLSLLAPEVFLQYGDYQARGSYRLSDRDTIGVFSFGSVDAAGSRQKSGNGEVEDVGSTQFHRIDTRWDHDLGRLGRVRTALTLGLDQSSDSQSFAIRDWLAGVRTEWDMPVSDTIRLRAGSDAWFDHYRLTMRSGSDPPLPTRDDVAAGARADVIVKVTPRLEIIPGLRVDLFESKAASSRLVAAIPTVDPRLSTRLRLSRNVTWITTNGLSHQPPSFIVPVPGFQLGSLGRGVQTAVQTSQGAEIELPWDLTLASSVFLHNYLDMTDATATCPFGNFELTAESCIEKRVRGRTIGLEVMLRRPLTKRFTGWISYTLSRSTRDTNPVGIRAAQSGLDIERGRAQTIPSDFDRTHVLNVIGALDLGLNWRIGARTVYYTGRPWSDRFHDVPVPPYNARRLPDFFRIDLRIEKRWLTSTGYWAFVAEGLNVTANKEVLDVKCRAAQQAPMGQAGSPVALDRCEPDTKGAIPVIVPLVGVEGAF